jgi:hypothetical protein
MRYLIIILFTLHTLPSLSQCEITKSNIDNGDTMFETGIVKLFTSNLTSCSCYSVMTVNSSNTDLAKFMIVILCVNESTKESFVPRKLKVNFEDGNSINLTAEEKLPVKEINGGRQVESCIFRPLLSTVRLLRSSKIKSLEFTDHYTGKVLTGTPYKSIFQDQFTCLFRDASEL